MLTPAPYWPHMGCGSSLLLTSSSLQAEEAAEFWDTTPMAEEKENG